MWFDRSIDLTLKTPTWVALFQSDRSRFRLVWFSSRLITLIIGGLQKACCKSPSVGELIASVWDVEAVVVDLGEMRDVIKVDKHFKSLLASVI